MNTKLLILLVVLVLTTIFIFQNTDVVELRFLFWKLAMSRALMFVFLLFIGIAAGWFLHSHLMHKVLPKKSAD